MGSRSSAWEVTICEEWVSLTPTTPGSSRGAASGANVSAQPETPSAATSPASLAGTPSPVDTVTCGHGACVIGSQSPGCSTTTACAPAGRQPPGTANLQPPERPREELRELGRGPVPPPVRPPRGRGRRRAHAERTHLHPGVHRDPRRPERDRGPERQGEGLLQRGLVPKRVVVAVHLAVQRRHPDQQLHLRLGLQEHPREVDDPGGGSSSAAAAAPASPPPASAASAGGASGSGSSGGWSRAYGLASSMRAPEEPSPRPTSPPLPPAPGTHARRMPSPAGADGQLVTRGCDAFNDCQMHCGRPPQLSARVGGPAGGPAARWPSKITSRTTGHPLMANPAWGCPSRGGEVARGRSHPSVVPRRHPADAVLGLVVPLVIQVDERPVVRLAQRVSRRKAARSVRAVVWAGPHRSTSGRASSLFCRTSPTSWASRRFISPGITTSTSTNSFLPNVYARTVSTWTIDASWL